MVININIMVLYDATKFLAFILTISVVIWIANFCWTRRKLNRLAKAIPGPKGYPLLGNSFDFLESSGEKILLKIMNYFDTNPEIYKFWIGPKLIIGISSPKALEIILNHNACLEKDTLIDVTKALFGNGVFSAPVRIWKKHRKLLNTFFNRKVLETFVPIIVKQSQRLANVLDKNCSSISLNIHRTFYDCTISSMNEIVMGVKLDAENESHLFGKWLEEALKIMLIRMSNVFYRMDFIFGLSKYKIIHDKMIGNVVDYIRNGIEKAKLKSLQQKTHLHSTKYLIEEQGDLPTKSFLDMLLHLPSNRTKLSTEDIKDETINLLAGGSESTATIMSFCCLLLGMHPDIQERAYREIIEIVGSDGEITSDVLSRLRYLECCILETMRLFPLGPTILRRTTADIKLENYTIPENSTLLICILHNQRSPKYWKEPLKFDPGRFTFEEKTQRHPYTYLPFSAGPRNCIGIKLAMLTIKIVMALILRKFVMKTGYTSVEEVTLELDVVLRPVNGFKVSVERR